MSGHLQKRGAEPALDRTWHVVPGTMRRGLCAADFEPSMRSNGAVGVAMLLTHIITAGHHVGLKRAVVHYRQGFQLPLRHSTQAQA
jgi:hypothetical protein